MAVQWTPAYIAIGSNLDDPQMQVMRALDALSALPGSMLIARSRLFRTQPLGPQDQPDFINAAAGMLTTLPARAFLAELQQIEAQMGKQAPAQRWGARRIDLDLIVFGEQRCDEPDLKVPHPGVSSRNFVLYPLLDIAPQLSIPGLGRVHELAQRVSHDGIAPLAR
jgi:2-amino-4-hydroxy-6-hydroxymethyldihydropteridine diphosphokinase